jgi:hypothetical protein
MINQIVRVNSPVSTMKPHFEEVERHGGPEAVAIYLIGLVSPKIRTLKAKLFLQLHW